MIQTSYYRISVRNPDNRPGKPFSAAVLADFHDEASAEETRALLHCVDQAQPLAVLCAGDMVTAKNGRCMYAHAVSLLKKLTARYPVYCVNGNHELRMKYMTQTYHGAYADYVDQIRAAGVTVLENESVFPSWNGMRFQLTGYEADLSVYKHFRPEIPKKSQLTQAIGQAQPGYYHILLAHHPDLFDLYAGWGADLTLSGHLHGGIVRLPGLGGVAGSNMKLFPRYDKGLFEKGSSKMIVSAGLGSHTIRLRINNPPELVIVTFSGSRK